MTRHRGVDTVPIDYLQHRTLLDWYTRDAGSVEKFAAKLGWPPSTLKERTGVNEFIKRLKVLGLNADSVAKVSMGEVRRRAIPLFPMRTKHLDDIAAVFAQLREQQHTSGAALLDEVNASLAAALQAEVAFQTYAKDLGPDLEPIKNHLLRNYFTHFVPSYDDRPRIRRMILRDSAVRKFCQTQNNPVALLELVNHLWNNQALVGLCALVLTVVPAYCCVTRGRFDASACKALVTVLSDCREEGNRSWLLQATRKHLEQGTCWLEPSDWACLWAGIRDHYSEQATRRGDLYSFETVVLAQIIGLSQRNAVAADQPVPELDDSLVEEMLVATDVVDTDAAAAWKHVRACLTSPDTAAFVVAESDQVYGVRTRPALSGKDLLASVRLWITVLARAQAEGTGFSAGTVANVFNQVARHPQLHELLEFVEEQEHIWRRHLRPRTLSTGHLLQPSPPLARTPPPLQGTP